ncbi:HET domain-containing protein [Achaetomium macrosporum]|uniref:HET domain-containing protein n=1 Tax=Achaetomium macrosporum TaxID=79813 RepID=A0AAN7CGZ9_9PEZI|nr:HET domain-containing protein [Achaetomium macrosporum]
MRLLNTTILELSQFTRDRPPYAILSHTWGPEEVTFQGINSAERAQEKGFAEIEGCCRQARADTLEWVWVDTCCIDKTSSAELSEAINSTYAWYRDSEVCYVYLEVVAAQDDGFPLESFRSARWFTRGWCLQELIAPTMFSKCNIIEQIRAIPKAVLLDHALDQCSIAQKMSWAWGRETTRVEDEAYCLLDLFGVNMPMLYGEGERAFYRLQEEIIKQTEDYSFLLWCGVPRDKQHRTPAARLPIFAPRPACFHRYGSKRVGVVGYIWQRQGRVSAPERRRYFCQHQTDPS